MKLIYINKLFKSIIYKYDEQKKFYLKIHRNLSKHEQKRIRNEIKISFNT